MAIAEMCALTLVALSAERSRILDTLQRTGSVQLTACRAASLPMLGQPTPTDELKDRIERTRAAVAFLEKELSYLPKPEKALYKDGFDVTIEEFYAQADERAAMESLVDEVEALADERKRLQTLRPLITAEQKSYLPYLGFPLAFDSFRSQKTCCYLGQVSADKQRTLEEGWKALDGYLTFYTGSGKPIVAAVVYHAQQAEASRLLSDAGFVACSFRGSNTAQACYDDCARRLDECTAAEENLRVRIEGYKNSIRPLKLYGDYLSFLAEKQCAEGVLGATQHTFVLDAYVPTASLESVKEALSIYPALYLAHRVIARDEYAPTLMQNGRVVENFQAVTNMYSVPAYGALDPNGLMSFFFSLFLGFIMGDAGYGLLMLVGGLLLAKKMRPGSTVHRMSKVFAIGGIFALLFGALFDSWMGFGLLRAVCGEGYNAFYTANIDAIASTCSLMGISIPSMLLWSLALGVVQISASLVMKAIQHFRRKQILDGIFGGLVWAIGWLSFVAWVFCLVNGYNPATAITGYITVGFMGTGLLTAGISAKGFGKVTKVFGAAYGLINYLSDILSYARLYGLMLSGAQIASIFTNTLALGMLFPKGPVGVIFGVILIIVGNLFNLAISMLGAFIHDSRLQYVEFFGRFYEGEGELFTPFGSTFSHIYLKHSAPKGQDQA